MSNGSVQDSPRPYPGVIRGSLGGAEVGDRAPVRLMAVLNASPESFYAGSVAADATAIARRAEQVTAEGADVVDVGAMSTAPYVRGALTADEEARRLESAVAAVRRATGLPISADTQRSLPARAALDAGATILNDVSGLADDAALAELAAAHGADLIVMARDLGPGRGSPLARVTSRLRHSIAVAERAGVALDRMAVDPGIGFTTRAEISAQEWNLRIIRDLARLRRLGRPILVGISRKRFIGGILGLDDPADRLVGSLAATAIAVANGAHVVRTHDVAATRQAVRIAEALRGAPGRGG